MNVIKGDLLKAEENIICHQVNPYTMGAGIAKQIRLKYPTAYIDYKRFSEHYAKGELLGRVCLSSIAMNKFVAHLFAQPSYGRQGCHTNYDALRSCLIQVKEIAEVKGLSVAIPYNIGCGLAGGDWNIVCDIINDVFDTSNVKCNLYKM